jgi:hypothetical protein
MPSTEISVYARVQANARYALSKPPRIETEPRLSAPRATKPPVRAKTTRSTAPRPTNAPAKVPSPETWRREIVNLSISTRIIVEQGVHQRKGKSTAEK